MAELFSILTYDYDKRDSATDPTLVDIGMDWTEIAHVTTDRPAGMYDMAMAIHWNYDRTTRSVGSRFSVDGVTWYEFSSEQADKSDSNATYFAFPYAHSGGPLELMVEIKKEVDDAKILEVVHAAAWIRRVN